MKIEDFKLKTGNPDADCRRKPVRPASLHPICNLQFVFIFLLLSPLLAWGQRRDEMHEPPLTPQQQVKAGRDSVAELLAQRPEANATNTGVMTIRLANDQERRVPIRFELSSTSTNVVSVYQALPAEGAPGEVLTVVHAGESPNQYYLVQPAAPGATNAAPVRLAGDQTMVPFAGSDFWVADLGLEFLYWPRQRVLRRELRHSQPCSVLESVNPRPAPHGCSRVVSWVDTDNGGILHADAYDARGKVLKHFDPTGLKKVNGRRQAEEMEMRNVQTGSHTWIKFNLPVER